MSEQIVYLNEKYHTGQVKDATQELVARSLQICDTCSQKTEELATVFGQNLSPVVVRYNLTLGLFSGTRIGKWSRSEVWVEKFLKLTGRLKDPNKDIKPLIGAEQPSYSDYNLPATRLMNFWEANFANLCKLATPTKKEQGTLENALRAYTESRIIRQALCNGIYLQRAVGT